MRRLILTLTLLALLALPALAYATQDTDARAVGLCAHLQQHAEAYSPEDIEACPSAAAALLLKVPGERRDAFTSCVSNQTPISKESFGQCVRLTLGEESARISAPGHPPMSPLTPTTQRHISEVCAHFRSLGVEADSAVCQHNTRLMAMVVGAETFSAYSSCVLKVAKHTPVAMKRCLKESGLEVALDAYMKASQTGPWWRTPDATPRDPAAPK